MTRPEVLIDTNDDFVQLALAGAAATPPREPRAFYNEDGDCIEFLTSDQGFRMERIDKLVTVYYGRETGEIVGALLKGVKRFVHEYLKDSPGFAIDVQDGHVRLACLFTAGMWKQGDSIRLHTYKKLRDAADQFDLSVDVPELVG